MVRRILFGIHIENFYNTYSVPLIPVRKQSPNMTTRIWLIINLCLLSWIHCWHGSGAFSTASTTAKKSRLGRYSRSHLHAIKAIFSDIDGSLLHYPKDDDTKTTSSDDDEYQILKLPPSATGMRGIISATTLRRCRDIRRWGVKLVLISGMRTSTMLNRLSHLPKADAYCTESGGRIFYPIEPPPEFEKNDMEVEADSDSPFPFRQATPLQYDGANPEDLTSFGLVEDMVWRQRMEDLKAAGKDGYPGNEVSSNRCDNIRDEDEYEECLIDYENMLGFPLEEDVIPVRDRKGDLWEFARHLQDEHGLILDTTSYSTCFRINKKHQSTPDHFDALMQGDIAIPSGLNVSTNLGCVDIYPISSGKRNW
jgi:hypothetical protein